MSFPGIGALGSREGPRPGEHRGTGVTISRMLAAVITCSDRAVSGAYSDRSGPLLRQALDALGFETRDPRIVPDNLVMIRAAIREAVASGARVVLTTGGTGVGPRDVTVEATLDLLACELPGIMEAIRRHGAEKTPRALLSRGLAGVVECAGTRAIIINAPGSEGGASDTIEVAGPLLQHLVEQLDGADH